MTLRIAGPARRDIADILRWSVEAFGPTARDRYEGLIYRAMAAITADDPASSRDAPGIGPGIRLYHLRNSRKGNDRPQVSRPRHLLAYRRYDGDLVVVVRVLHDASDLPSRFQDGG